MLLGCRGTATDGTRDGANGLNGANGRDGREGEYGGKNAAEVHEKRKGCF